MLLVRNVFGQSGRGDVRQPVEDCLAPDTGDLTVSIEVRLRDFIGMKFQYQIGTADVRGGIAATGIGPIDHDGLRRLAQNVSGMKIAVAQVIAIGHVLEAIQQDLPLRLVEKRCSGDPCCQPTLQAAELIHHVGVNARLQAHEDLKALGYGGRVTSGRSEAGNDSKSASSATSSSGGVVRASIDSSFSSLAAAASSRVSPAAQPSCSMNGNSALSW